ncbi:hypothetical protein AX774_g2212 [Zancudomyces culisetae]|uniref:Uncharacterized protein n=1 Tax=Zancudomyces culisetae TaxID=1213189 RepID=A0A1R1PTJ0_ZANCU|nr:hypothetical protein AX774_g2212 [Zancudomyces culisetae]|eukprot:OMH84267.1 hypothetical protein AX774_g2212 [Zancudomyces culisetae]
MNEYLIGIAEAARDKGDMDMRAHSVDFRGKSTEIESIRGEENKPAKNTREDEMNFESEKLRDDMQRLNICYVDKAGDSNVSVYEGLEMGHDRKMAYNKSGPGVKNYSRVGNSRVLDFVEKVTDIASISGGEGSGSEVNSTSRSGGRNTIGRHVLSSGDSIRREQSVSPRNVQELILNYEHIIEGSKSGSQTGNSPPSMMLPRKKQFDRDRAFKALSMVGPETTVRYTASEFTPTAPQKRQQARTLLGETLEEQLRRGGDRRRGMRGNMGVGADANINVGNHPHRITVYEIDEMRRQYQKETKEQQIGTRMRRNTNACNDRSVNGDWSGGNRGNNNVSRNWNRHSMVLGEGIMDKKHFDVQRETHSRETSYLWDEGLENWSGADFTRDPSRKRESTRNGLVDSGLTRINRGNFSGAQRGGAVEPLRSSDMSVSGKVFETNTSAKNTPTATPVTATAPAIGAGTRVPSGRQGRRDSIMVRTMSYQLSDLREQEHTITYGNETQENHEHVIASREENRKLQKLVNENMNLRIQNNKLSEYLNRVTDGELGMVMEEMNRVASSNAVANREMNQLNIQLNEYKTQLRDLKMQLSTHLEDDRIKSKQAAREKERVLAMLSESERRVKDLSAELSGHDDYIKALQRENETLQQLCEQLQHDSIEERSNAEKWMQLARIKGFDNTKRQVAEVDESSATSADKKNRYRESMATSSSITTTIIPSSTADGNYKNTKESKDAAVQKDLALALKLAEQQRNLAHEEYALAVQRYEAEICNYQDRLKFYQDRATELEAKVNKLESFIVDSSFDYNKDTNSIKHNDDSELVDLLKQKLELAEKESKFKDRQLDQLKLRLSTLSSIASPSRNTLTPVYQKQQQQQQQQFLPDSPWSSVYNKNVTVGVGIGTSTSNSNSNTSNPFITHNPDITNARNDHTASGSNENNNKNNAGNIGDIDNTDLIAARLNLLGEKSLQHKQKAPILVLNATEMDNKKDIIINEEFDDNQNGDFDIANQPTQRQHQPPPPSIDDVDNSIATPTAANGAQYCIVKSRKDGTPVVADLKNSTARLNLLGEKSLQHKQKAPILVLNATEMDNKKDIIINEEFDDNQNGDFDIANQPTQRQHQPPPPSIDDVDNSIATPTAANGAQYCIVKSRKDGTPVVADLKNSSIFTQLF